MSLEPLVPWTVRHLPLVVMVAVELVVWPAAAEAALTVVVLVDARAGAADGAAGPAGSGGRLAVPRAGPADAAAAGVPAIGAATGVAIVPAGVLDTDCDVWVVEGEAGAAVVVVALVTVAGWAGGGAVAG